MTLAEVQTAYDRQLRDDILTEARTWLGTPFQDKQMMKGAGCDCATFVYQVFVPKFCPETPLPDYPVQWYLHEKQDENGKRVDNELYLDMLRKCGFREIAQPSGAGDVFIIKFGRTFAHAGIVIEWPQIIFANPRVKPARVTINNFHDNPMFQCREVKFFSLFA